MSTRSEPRRIRTGVGRSRSALQSRLPTFRVATRASQLTVPASLSAPMSLGEALADDATNHAVEPIGIARFDSVVVPESLLVKVRNRWNSSTLMFREATASGDSRSSPSCSCERCRSHIQQHGSRPGERTRLQVRHTKAARR